MCPVIVSGIVTGNTLVSYGPPSSLYLATLPEIFAKVYSAQFPLDCKVAI